MTDRLEEIRARWADIEDPPWSVGDHPEHRDVSVVDCVGGPVADVGFGEDAEAIAHAPEDVAFLLAIVAERDATIETLCDRRLEAESRAEGYRIERDERPPITCDALIDLQQRWEAAEAEVARLKCVLVESREQ